MSKIKNKRSTTTAIPTVEFGEIAYTNIAGVSKVFIGDSSNVPVEIAGDSKMDKVSDSTANNILTVDATGQAIDSGKKFNDTGTTANDVLSAEAVISKINSKQNLITNPVNNNFVSTDALGQTKDSGLSFEVNVLTGSPTAVPSSFAVSKAIQVAQQGLDTKQSAVSATTAPLPSVTALGTGVGKTLTATANGVLSIDGVSTWVDVNTNSGSTDPYATTSKASRVLIKNQINAIDNGIYVVTNKGSSSTRFVLTRSTDADDGTKLNPQAYIFVESGTTNINSGFALSNTSPIIIDTTALNFTQFAGVGSTILAGTGLAKTDNTLSVKPDTTTFGFNIANVINATSAGLNVFVDGTTIGGNGATALSVLNGGITSAKIATNTISNFNLTQASAKTWKGNNTGAFANVSDNFAGSLEAASSVLTITGGSNALLNSASIGVKQATTSQDGFLSNTDWNTFNNKLTIDSQQTLSATGSITAWNSTVYVSGTSNITLPTPTGNAGKKLTIKKTDTGTITIILPASGLIDGGANFEMPYQHDSITIESNGTNYFIIASHSNTIDGGVF